MKIFDLSPVLHSGIAVWPGDRSFERVESLQLSRGDTVNLSSIEASLHTGCHADAPRHFEESGASIDEVELEHYWGPARVVTVAASSGAIEVADLEASLTSWPERLLIRANPLFDPDHFPVRICTFTPAAAERIGRAGTLLVGIDAPSVDPIESEDLPAHRIFGRYQTAILENLALRAVADGDYELVAVPLRIAGADASPVRALLKAL